MTNLDTFSFSDHMSLQAPAESALANSINMSEQHSVFGKPLAADQASLQARENATFPSGTVDFNQHQDIYGSAGQAALDTFQGTANTVCDMLGVPQLQLNSTELSMGNGGAYNDGLGEPLFTSKLVDSNPSDLISSFLSGAAGADQPPPLIPTAAAIFGLTDSSNPGLADTLTGSADTAAANPDAVRQALQTDVPMASGMMVRGDKLSAAVDLYMSEMTQRQQ
jgi:hypothetical protein